MLHLDLRTTLRLCLLAIISLATLEFCARVQDCLTRGVPVWSFSYQAPPIYAYGGKGPHGIPLARDGKYVMNSIGFRGPEVRADRPTVLCLGASETFGVYESPGAEYPRQLERILNEMEPRKDFQVVNAAYPGERLEEIASTLQQTLNRVHPRYAVIYPSIAGVAWTRSAWEALHPTPASKDPPPERWGRWRLHDHILALFGTPVPKPKSAVTPRSRLPERNIREFHRELLHLVRALRRRGVQPVLATHATRFGRNGQYRDAQLQKFEAYYPVVTAAGLFDAERRMNAVVVAVARADRDPVVDAARLIAPGPANFADFVHFTDRGSADMARLLSEAIVSLGRN